MFDPASLTYDDRGLIPAIAQDRVSGEVLMLAWMNAEAVARTLATGRVTYWSRSRAAFWVKGETSGHVQELVELRLDCDRDAFSWWSGRPARPATPARGLLLHRGRGRRVGRPRARPLTGVFPPHDAAVSAANNVSSQRVARAAGFGAAQSSSWLVPRRQPPVRPPAPDRVPWRRS